MAMRLDALMLGIDGATRKVRIDGINYLVEEAHEMIRAGMEIRVRPPPPNPDWLATAILEPGTGRRIVGAGLNAGGQLDLRSLGLPCPPIKLFAFGDSIQWGQGLRATEKIYRLLAARLSIANNGAAVTTANFAGSGAILGNGNDNSPGRGLGTTGGEITSGEVPSTVPTVRRQIALAPPGANIAADPNVDFVIIDGGINDVRLGQHIIRYTDNRPAIRKRTADLVGPRMRAALEMLVGRYPNARIAVTGYYPIVTSASTTASPAQFALAVARMRGIASTNPPSLAGKKWLVANCDTFYRDSNGALRSAVATVNNSVVRRVVFFDPGFSPGNALFARRSLLWGIAANGDALDPIGGARAALCDAAISLPSPGNLACRLTSIGHPTPAGAVKYADAINAFF